ncbi:helix-turn-helix domain-containing protein [Bacillus subtilis]|uniref:helix-turn-helix domain-containing protein n=1 Tax=Pseudochrobactrum asaccharolyticum TaxID=354351 RepID=UPI001F400841|nr:helix-turn-helix transcriptional regulator [Pseudochrobactrum asaccharolyticum]MCF7644612.1 helix-turn-helix domain-containing protein [Pseudochrobactrum asaccharolyticum]MCF7670149.1 helix-turn-helix domain-containing protein [Bacillus subtilis]
MTPFGLRLRQLREERGVSQKEMAAAIRVSAAYLSALEHGRRGQPTWDLLQRMIGYLNIIWDEAEELQNLAMISHPRVTIDTAGLSPQATELANLLANHIQILDEETIANLSTMLRQAYKKHRSLR